MSRSLSECKPQNCPIFLFLLLLLAGESSDPFWIVRCCSRIDTRIIRSLWRCLDILSTALADTVEFHDRHLTFISPSIACQQVRQEAAGATYASTRAAGRSGGQSTPVSCWGGATTDAGEVQNDFSSLRWPSWVGFGNWKKLSARHSDSYSAKRFKFKFFVLFKK